MKKIKNILFIYFFFLFILIILGAIIALIFSKSSDPVDSNKIRIATFFMGNIAFLFLGILSGFIEKKRGLITGLAYGIGAVIFGFLFNLLAFDNQIESFIKPIIYLVSSSLGAVISVNLSKK